MLEVISKCALYLASASGSYLLLAGCIGMATSSIYGRGFWKASMALAGGVFWITFHPAVSGYLQGLGGDSFGEATSFSYEEAIFWLGSLRDLIRPLDNAKIFALNATAASLVALAVAWFSFRISNESAKALRRLRVASVVLVCFACGQTLFSALRSYSSNTASYELVSRNFGAYQGGVLSPDKPIKVLLYIGESTTVMHMGLYGYPRDTTPRLAMRSLSDPGMLVYHNVLATHTHTSASLLEALSAGVNPMESYLPIEERSRVPVTSILQQAGVGTRYFSNQGQSGTWNQAASIVFKNAVSRYSTRSEFAGNGDGVLPRPWDHMYFQESFPRGISQADAPSELIVFHSYAGHGDYEDYVPPEFRGVIDASLASIPSAALLGGARQERRAIETYDSAMRYVDFCVDSAIEAVAQERKAMVFVYFSDHGESAYSGRAHDSSRVTHEMLRVPLIVYFNAAARETHSDLFERYRHLARSGRMASLDQLSSTLLDLFGADANAGPAYSFVSRPVFGEDVVLPPLLVRRTAEGITYVDANAPGKIRPVPRGTVAKVRSDSATQIYAAESAKPKNIERICYHRSDTYASGLRGRLVASCLEMDVVVTDKGELAVHHPPAADVGYRLDLAFALAQAKGMAVWLDAKNLNDPRACRVLADFLERDAHRSAQPILVEFPSGSHLTASDLRDCVARLRKIGVFTSYYVPTRDSLACASDINRGGTPPLSAACDRLKTDLEAAFASGLFTDFSFDYAGVLAMRSTEHAESVRWNAWGIAADKLVDLHEKRVRLVIPDNSDSNAL